MSERSDSESSDEFVCVFVLFVYYNNHWRDEPKKSAMCANVYEIIRSHMHIHARIDRICNLVNS